MPIVSKVDGMRAVLAEQAARLASRRRWFSLRNDRESALIRFLSNYEDESSPGGQSVAGKFHQERIALQGGGQRMGDPVLCSEDEDCNLCAAQGEPSKFLTLYWVFVYHVDHMENNPSIGRFADAEPWEPVQVGGGTMFREQVNGPRILKAGSRMATQIMTIWGQEGSLLTRDFTITRAGKRGDTSTSYTFYPQDKGAFTAKVAQLIPIEDYATGKVPFSDEEVKQSGGRTAAPAPVRPEVPDEDLANFGTDEPEAEVAPEDEGSGEEGGNPFEL